MAVVSVGHESVYAPLLCTVSVNLGINAPNDLRFAAERFVSAPLRHYGDTVLASDAPRYSEAYPRISVGEAWKSRRGEKTVLLLRNQLRHVVGMIEPIWVGPERIVIHPYLKDIWYSGGTTHPIPIDIVMKGSNSDNARPYAVCFGCGRHHDIIVYADTVWRCKNCLRLLNRTALLDDIVNISIEIGALESQIGAGRPLRMRQAAYEQKLHRLGELQKRLGRHPRRSPDDRYRFWISGTWEARSPFHDHFGAERPDE